jgi:hypothetical protein
VRAFGIPSNKEDGAMVNGLLPKKIAYYSVGVFNGDGQNFKNTDSKFDLMGRAWVAPLAAAGIKELEDAEIGGSFWVGKRGTAGLPLTTQTTQGGLTFLDNKLTVPGAAAMTTSPAELHQAEHMTALALEVNVPVMHRFGARYEYVHKSQDLSVNNIATPATPVAISPAKLEGYSMYGELWFWLVGDDTILPQAGLELQPRLKKYENAAPRHGVMLAARLERLNETVSVANPGALAADHLSGTHGVTSGEFGVNYWYSKRYRATFNYVLNSFGGSADGNLSGLKTTLNQHTTEHEFLFRMAVAL